MCGFLTARGAPTRGRWGRDPARAHPPPRAPGPDGPPAGGSGAFANSHQRTPCRAVSAFRSRGATQPQDLSAAAAFAAEVAGTPSASDASFCDADQPTAEMPSPTPRGGPDHQITHHSQECFTCGRAASGPQTPVHALAQDPRPPCRAPPVACRHPPQLRGMIGF